MGVIESLTTYNNLLDKEYHIVLGYKNVETSICISFDKKDWRHTMGLHYLNLDFLNVYGKKLEELYDDILKGKYTNADFESAKEYTTRISNRINLFADMENILDNINNKAICFYKFDNRWCIGTHIDAEYLVHHSTEYINLFLYSGNKNKNGEIVIGEKSLFSSKTSELDYSKGQKKLYVLLNEKVDKRTNETIELYRNPRYKK